jgi:formyl-CoA transferase
MTVEPRKALEGLRVLDVTQVMAGPFCAMQLCDMGADVIKVEPPEGDSTRRMSGARGSDSPSFNAVNRGKRGIVLNLKAPVAQSAFRRLARHADVIIENYRPGVMKGFGLDYASLAAGNPGLIYASISGYGQTGPASGKGGFDLVAQGVSGLMSVTGEPGGPPMKVGVPLTDLGAGLYALSAILAALYYRSRTGRGQYIDTSLVEAGVALSVWESAEYFAGGKVPQAMGSAHRMTAPYQAVRCADGFITLAAANDRLFRRLCELLGHSEWTVDPDFIDDTGRVRNRARLVALIESQTTERSCAEWIAIFEANGLPCGPINNYEQVFADPQLRFREMVVETDHPTLGHLRTLGSPVKMSETPPLAGRRAPLLGEHTDEVLAEAGFTTDEIAAIRIGDNPVGEEGR